MLECIIDTLRLCMNYSEIMQAHAACRGLSPVTNSRMVKNIMALGDVDKASLVNVVDTQLAIVGRAHNDAMKSQSGIVNVNELRDVIETKVLEAYFD